MISGSGTTLDAAAVLASARGARATADAAEAQLLADAVAWAHLHTVTDLDDAATWWSGSKTMGQDTGIPIAGPGCPLVSEFAVAEFATALKMTQDTGRHYVGQALELAHRLPRLWARVQDGSLPAWRARRVAEHTLHLTQEAAGFVDRMVAPYAHKTGPAQTQRIIDEAIARFMPEHAREQAERSAEQRYVTIEHQQVSFAGTSRIHGELDLPDALDLEDALQRGAEQLKALGNHDTLDVRRAAALGALARGQQLLEFESDTVSAGKTPTTAGQGAPKSRREVVLHAHLSADAVRSGIPETPAWVEDGGGWLLTTGQVADWCGRTDVTGVVVKHVIDLNETITCTGYQPSPRLTEQVRLRDRTCVFPHCHRPARACDLDHIVAHAERGSTSSDNLACLCRLHHRLKTHGGWTYQMTRPGVFLWQSPRGHTWRRDRTGTTDLTPPTIDKPGRPPGDPPGQPPDG
jgi:hypothetical protein